MPAFTLSVLAIRYVGMETRETTSLTPGGSMFVKNFSDAGNSQGVAAFERYVKKVSIDWDREEVRRQA
jgi:hypothetical protein